MENVDKNTPDFEQDDNKNEGEQNHQENNQDDGDQKPDHSNQKDDERDWKAEALKLRAILDRNKESNKELKNKSLKNKSDDLDYGQKAFLVANGIKGEDEIKLAKQYMSETGKTLEQVLDSKFFKSDLEEMRELSKTRNATPESRRSGTVPTDSVDYWMTKPIEEVPQEMRIKVVNKRLEQSNSKGVFYNS